MVGVTAGVIYSVTPISASACTLAAAATDVVMDAAMAITMAIIMVMVAMAHTAMVAILAMAMRLMAMHLMAMRQPHLLQLLHLLHLPLPHSSK